MISKTAKILLLRSFPLNNQFVAQTLLQNGPLGYSKPIPKPTGGAYKRLQAASVTPFLLPMAPLGAPESLLTVIKWFKGPLCEIGGAQYLLLGKVLDLQISQNCKFFKDFKVLRTCNQPSLKTSYFGEAECAERLNN